MEEFNEDCACVKCGFDWNAINYSSPYIDYQVGVFNSEKQDNYFDVVCGENEEYLMRTCCRCGYKWSERCVESKDKKEIHDLTKKMLKKMELLYGHEASLVIFEDYSGHIQNYLDTEVFDFANWEELAKYLGE